MSCWKLMSLCLGLTMLFVGCVGDQDGYRELGDADDVTNTNPDDHHHHHDHAAGPHGGHILEFGDYHGEIAMDDSRTVNVYVLGDDAKTAVPLADATATLHLHVGEEEVEVVMTPEPQDGEADGQTSRFTAKADAIPESVKDIEGIHGEVILKVADKSMTAAVEHDHDHHDHAH